MEEFLPGETERQERILRALRRKQSLELGAAGVAARIIAADLAVNANETQEQIGEGELLYPFRQRVTGTELDMEQFDLIGRDDPGLYAMLQAFASAPHSAMYLINLGRQRVTPSGMHPSVYHAGLGLYRSTNPSGPEPIWPIEPIALGDVSFINSLMQTTIRLKREANLHILNDNLLNELVDYDHPFPLP